MLWCYLCVHCTQLYIMYNRWGVEIYLFSLNHYIYINIKINVYSSIMIMNQYCFFLESFGAFLFKSQDFTLKRGALPHPSPLQYYFFCLKKDRLFKLNLYQHLKTCKNKTHTMNVSYTRVRGITGSASTRCWGGYGFNSRPKTRHS